MLKGVSSFPTADSVAYGTGLFALKSRLVSVFSLSVAVDLKNFSELSSISLKLLLISATDVI